MIFYFSGTGNTQWAAKTLAQVANEKLIAIADAPEGECHYTLAADERIGFCFPTHGWQPPAIVRRFINRLRLSSPHPALTTHYCFALTTCGDSIGQTMEMLNHDLQAIGLKTDSVYSLIMPESYVCLPFMYTDTPEKEAQKINTSRQQLQQIATEVKERQKGIVKTVKGAAPWLMTHVIGSYFNKRMVTDKKFTVDAEACVRCGKCEKVCPTGDVRLNADKLPEWQHNGSCTCCLACYHHCPKHAINYGSITRKRGQYYFRVES